MFFSSSLFPGILSLHLFPSSFQPDSHPTLLTGGGEETNDTPHHLGFDVMAFSADGEFLATVSKAPNRLLTLWYWQNAEGAVDGDSQGICTTPLHCTAPLFPSPMSLLVWLTFPVVLSPSVLSCLAFFLSLFSCVSCGRDAVAAAAGFAHYHVALRLASDYGVWSWLCLSVVHRSLS